MPAAPMELAEVARGPVHIKTTREMHGRITIITRSTATILERERVTGQGQEAATMTDTDVNETRGRDCGNYINRFHQTHRVDRGILVLARARVAVIVEIEVDIEVDGATADHIRLVNISIDAAIALHDRDRGHEDAITEADVTRVLALHVAIIQGGGATRGLPLPIEVKIDVTGRPRLAAEILLGARPLHNLLSPGVHDYTESSTRHRCLQLHHPYRLIEMKFSAHYARDSMATHAFAATTRKANYRYDRAFFLYDCRQGLGPVATTLDCSHIVATPGFHVRDVLTVDQTRQIFNKVGRLYFDRPVRELDYRQFGTIQEEALKVPATPQLGRGPPPSLHTRAGDVHLPGTSNDLVLRISRPQPAVDTRMPFGPMRTPQPALIIHNTSRSLSQAQLRETGHLQRLGIKTETNIDAHQKAPKDEGDGSQSPIIKTERDDPVYENIVDWVLGRRKSSVSIVRAEDIERKELLTLSLGRQHQPLIPNRKFREQNDDKALKPA
ncbi:hypothetical protein FHL15_001656 [Xylaria flabelliformis]|uniref:Uncharacterized protein n=1 Tax=Xylaria flabelliformis TaxID=2512241 RepID=A0A553IAZ5_9PEZI|nr:hypothetical protein FHL15_001656 [Xylaria flabelliformis]